MPGDAAQSDPHSAEARYRRLVASFEQRPGVAQSTSKGFGGETLQVGGRIFAMLVRGKLVVKLPKPSVDALVADGRGDRFDANRGQPMKEWLVLAGEDEAEWAALAEAALRFVSAG